MARRRHHRHLQRRQFDYEPVTHVWGGGYYLSPGDTGYYTAQSPHGAADCPDPATCAAHAGDPTAGAGGAVGADSGATAGTTSGGTV